MHIKFLERLSLTFVVNQSIFPRAQQATTSSHVKLDNAWNCSGSQNKPTNSSKFKMTKMNDTVFEKGLKSIFFRAFLKQKAKRFQVIYTFIFVLYWDIFCDFQTLCEWMRKYHWGPKKPWVVSLKKNSEIPQKNLSYIFSYSRKSDHKSVGTTKVH